MIVLSLETSGSIFSAAVFVEGKIIEQYQSSDSRKASTVIASTIKSLITNANLSIDDFDYAIYNSGPGSFTGLRVGLSFLKGLFFLKKARLIPIPAFDALMRDQNEVSVGFFESKRDEIYVYKNKEILPFKKSDFNNLFSLEQPLVTYSSPIYNMDLTKFNITFKEQNAIELYKTFIENIPSYTNQKSHELIYIYG